MSFLVNGRRYEPPALPLAAICLDGSADEYLDAAMARGRMPHLSQMAVDGWRGMARAALPSFTNVNNASLVTGVPPSVHGISGNYFLNPETGEEVMMNDASFLRAETILAAAGKAGRKPAVATAKDKLRAILSKGMAGIGLSAEKATDAECRLAGMDRPAIYSADASLFVLRAGVGLLERGAADFLYLSLTDYIQHKHAPDEPEALEFYAAIDIEIGRLLALGARVGATADHGMNAKQKADGAPEVLFLESELVEEFGPGIRVILPITDPYVAHHGALGSFACVHLPEELDPGEIGWWISERPGITEVYEREDAARRLELPADRIGDLVALSGRTSVIGRTPQDHDLRAVAGLRSHGGRYEEMVPFVVSAPLSGACRRRAQGDLRNFDLFDFLCNGAA